LNLFNKIKQSKTTEQIQKELNEEYKKIIDKSINEPNFDKLLAMFNLNPEVKDSRAFAGLTREASDGINKYKYQLEVLGNLFKDLDNINQLNNFLIEALEKHDNFVKTLPNSILKDQDQFIDMKFLLIKTLQNPQISNINTISSLELLKNIFSEKVLVKDKNNIIGEANLKPLMDEIDNIKEDGISENDIMKISSIYTIIESMSTNKDDEKLKEIQKLLSETQDNFKRIKSEQINNIQEKKDRENLNNISGF